IPKAGEKEYYPMSSAQKRTYLLNQMDSGEIVYNMPEHHKLMGEVRPEKLREALQKLINRHEILRTSFTMIDGEPVQKILLHVEADFEYMEHSDESDEDLIDSFVKPFDLSNPPLVRVRLVNRGDYHLLSIDIHHIISDGMSSAIFTRELNALYNGEKLVPLTHQFKDYSEWMRTRDLSSQADYWKSQFNDEIPVLDMPLDYVRPQEQSYEGSILVRGIGKELTNKVKKIALENGATDFMVFMSAAMVLLSKYSRQEDIVIGTPISGRTHRDTEGMLGMFVNTLAMRGKPEAEKTYREFLAEIKETSLRAYENQEYPFEELVEAVDVTRDMSRSPLFDVMLSLQNNEVEEINLGDTDAEWTDAKDSIAKFDLSFDVVEYKGEYGVILEYCTALFKEESARLLVNHFIVLIEDLISDINKKLKDVQLINEGEKSEIIDKFNTKEVTYPRNITAVEMFEEQVEKNPENIAVVFEDKEVSYKELNEAANALGHKLRDLGVYPDDFVAIITDRSLEMIEAIFGVLKSGGTYLPIDPTYPEDRIKFMLEDTNPKAVLVYTDEEISIVNDMDIPVIDLADGEVFKGMPENLERVNKAEDAVYCIYTSGTTGKPKGVVLENTGLIGLVKSYEDVFEMTEEDRMMQFASYCFDQSVGDIFGTILNGATLYVVSTDMRYNMTDLEKYMKSNKITVASLTPKVIRELDVCNMKDLRLLDSGGEAAELDVLRKIAASGKKIINSYGPTEATVNTTYSEIKEDTEKVVIGKPACHTQVYIVNGDNLCGIGVPGELCITGDGLARGYLNREELTAEKFVKNPFGEGRMYHSGDLARWLPDGNIEYLGRIDEQVKIRGFRVELGEIESRIREIEGISDATVIARNDENGDKAIYAYYVVEEGEISVSAIRETLSVNLPDYMIPAYMMQIEKIPVNKNGKLDRKALPDIEVKTEREYIAPRN
ncbi:MAG TPA: non-ribosomal peptide synthetase, partial [Eubacterium sp.]|nr:non-ribosomal peptide synthetase [Eubacterium sp.]